MERMIDAPDINQAFKIFNELSYADELLDMESPEQYREILTHDLKQTRDFLLTIIPNPAVSDLVFAADDFHNLKIIFKAKCAGFEEVEHTSLLGTIEVENLIEIILKQNTKITLPDYYHSLVKEALLTLEKKHQPQEIDSYFDKKYFAFILKKARELKDNFLINLIKEQIDIANIKIIVRSKLLDRFLEDVSHDVVAEGKLSTQDLLASYQGELAGIIKVIADNYTQSQIRDEANKFLEKNNLGQLDKALDNYLIGLIKEAKMILPGPNIIVAYFLAKKNAVKNIRIIMTAKINNIPGQEIKAVVRELY
jgi:V/A-type H+-transporting ATPase subunit C